MTEILFARVDDVDASAALAAQAAAEAAQAAAEAAAASLTDEAIQDLVGAMFSGNTETRATVTYQDSDGTIDVVVDADLANYDNSTALFLDETAADALYVRQDDNTFLTEAAGDAAYQPLNGHLTDIAALNTSAAGRAALELTDPGEDRVAMWDESAGAWKFATLSDLTEETDPDDGDYFLMVTNDDALVRVNWNELPAGGGGGGSSDVQDFTDLDDVPSAYTGAGGFAVAVTAGEDGLEFVEFPADTPTAITVANEATDTTCFPLFVTAATGDLGPKTNAGLAFNSNTGRLSLLTDAQGLLALGASADVLVGRAAAANLRLGAADASSATAQTLSVQNVATGASNTAGADFTIANSLSTGNAAGGRLVITGVRPGQGGSGSTQNTALNQVALGSNTASWGGTIEFANNSGSFSSCMNIGVDNNGGLIFGRVGTSGVAGVHVGLSTFNVAASAMFGVASITGPGNSADCLLGRNGAAAWRFGSADAAAPVAQTLAVQSVVAGTSNTAGQDWKFEGSQGTGTGAGGAILFQTAAAGGSGSSQNALATVLTLQAAGNVYVNNSLELGNSSDTTLSRSAAGVLAVENVVVAMTGKQTIYIPASAMTARITSGATASSREINSITVPTMAFPDGADTGANFSIAFPKNWNAGTVTYQAFWTAASGSGTVEFELRGGSFANDAAINVTGLGTAVAVSDTLIAANDVHVTSESSAVTLSNAADDTMSFFEIIRDISDDTLAVNAELIGIKFHYTTDAGNDA